MKIVTWNCNGALRNKIETLSAFDADLYLIQECENPELSINKSYKDWASNFLWRGDNKNKGIGIFAKKDTTIEAIDWPDNYKDNKVRHFLPCMVNNDFQLVNIWTSQNKSPNFGYIGQLWKYIELNKENFKKIILAGDFNSNSIWDQWDRWWNHTDVVNDLYKMDIHSLYHTYFKEQQGKETRPTFFLQRNIMKPYHIDYAFASKALKTNMRQFKIGDKKKWLRYSDHLPLFFEIENL
ncbi:MAG: endonuclease/exonuclease/phosphatase family protein [Sediminibacterium sp.]|uniref:endonuclease/exonuclease/phosphatase family protein n=1 Tax=Sediminibacterium sp. TaxID=1917865 RepID=UPI002ABA9CB1|nr:endonuclease/exonuclease/phosphatase family protein [Sediminibacterium sp.]MDZ4070274.1 endonuclease/exonuclease/phosphatase family protein [Sediminibacterium sp.]